MDKFDLEALKRDYVASDERGDAKFSIDFHDMTIVLERLEQAEQAVARVREVAAEYRPSIPEEVLHEVMKDILRALDGDGRG